jgi:phosphoribosyl-AMP cyclohydrolase / phosphoribosyl-ATP pyrophosphohydrolase
MDGRVLMVGWMDREAFDATIATGEVHFHSRSRDRLWRKGETSGKSLHVRRLALDCDADAVLLEVDPAGPTCHRGTRSCFDPDGAPGERTSQGLAWLETLWSVVESRARERPIGSHTASLVEGGVDATSRKVTEEATEVLIAAKNDAAAEGAGVDRAKTRDSLVEETADLVYHVLVLIAERGLSPSPIVDVLRSRYSD